MAAGFGRNDVRAAFTDLHKMKADELFRNVPANIHELPRLLLSFIRVSQSSPSDDLWTEERFKSDIIPVYKTRKFGRRRSMERFLQERNVVLYRRLRNSSTGETERRMIIRLLVEQMDKLKMTKNEGQQDKPGKSLATFRH
jgi:hypothetical protein